MFGRFYWKKMKWVADFRNVIGVEVGQEVLQVQVKEDRGRLIIIIILLQLLYPDYHQWEVLKFEPPVYILFAICNLRLVEKITFTRKVETEWSPCFCWFSLITKTFYMSHSLLSKLQTWVSGHTKFIKVRSKNYQVGV